MTSKLILITIVSFLAFVLALYFVIRLAVKNITLKKQIAGYAKEKKLLQEQIDSLTVKVTEVLNETKKQHESLHTGDNTSDFNNSVNILHNVSKR